MAQTTNNRQNDDSQTFLTDGKKNNQQQQNQNGDDDIPEGTRDLTATGGFGVTDNGGRDNAGKVEDSGGAMQMLGLATGAAFATQCGPHHPFPCAAAAMSFLDALASGKTADKANYTGMQFDPYGNPYKFDGNNPVLKARNDEIIKRLKDLEDMGYTANPDGSVTMPTGAKISSAELNSVQGLMGQGLSEAEATSTLEKMQATKAKAAKSLGMGGGASGSGTGMGELGGAQTGAGAALGAVKNKGGSSDSGLSDDGSGEGGAGGDFGGLQSGNGKNGKLGRMPASQAAKLKKDFRGTPIGIGMADLFLIVNQKYTEKKSNKNEFINREY